MVTKDQCDAIESQEVVRDSEDALKKSVGSIKAKKRKRELKNQKGSEGKQKRKKTVVKKLSAADDSHNREMTESSPKVKDDNDGKQYDEKDSSNRKKCPVNEDKDKKPFEAKRGVMKKKSQPPGLTGSVNLLANFLKRAKTKESQEESMQREATKAAGVEG